MPERKKRTPRETPKKGDKRPTISDRDELILEYLLTHRVASSDDLRALIGGELTNFQERLRELTAWDYLKRPDAQFNWRKAYNNPCVYAIGDAGVKHRQASGDWREPPRGHPLFFAHDLIACRVEASLQIGAAKHGLRFIPWAEILQSQRFPRETAEASKPWLIPDVPVGTDKKGATLTKDVEADTMPFGISRMVANQEIFFFTRGIEADGNTEPWRRYSSEGSSLYDKLVADLELIERRTCEKRFGFPNCYMLYVFCERDRMHRIIEEFKNLTNGNGSRFILFNYFPRFNSKYDTWPKPTGHMLTEDWQRVGGPPFNFLSS